MSSESGEGRTGGKVAFCFPGQGAIEAGMGREIAEAVPEAMAVYERGSESCGLDLRALCFTGPVEDLVDTAVQQPALLATSLGILAAIEALGFKPDFVIGHSVGEFAALSAGKALDAADAIALVRERGLAMAETAKENPGAMAAILGLDDEVVEELCREIHCVWPANYNCPGQVVISGQTDAVDECCEEAQREGARRTVKLPISGAFHSPSRRSADRAGALDAVDERPDRKRSAHLRRGWAGQRAFGPGQAHRPQRGDDLGQQPGLTQEGRGGAVSCLRHTLRWRENGR
jgi:[acyl-carrier-protein] S-malonyltransferase